jgi:hypothetical protein
MDCLHVVRRKHANPLQFLVREVGLFFVADAFHMAQSRFLRNAPEFCFRYAEKEGSSGLRNIFRDLIVHDLLLWRDYDHASFFDTAIVVS